MIDGKTGILFSEQTKDSLAGAIQKSLQTSWDTEEIVQHANEWNAERFDRGILDIVEGVL